MSDSNVCSSSLQSAEDAQVCLVHVGQGVSHLSGRSCLACVISSQERYTMNATNMYLPLYFGHVNETDMRLRWKHKPSTTINL